MTARLTIGGRRVSWPDDVEAARAMALRALAERVAAAGVAPVEWGGVRLVPSVALILRALAAVAGGAATVTLEDSAGQARVIPVAQVRAGLAAWAAATGDLDAQTETVRAAIRQARTVVAIRQALPG